MGPGLALAWAGGRRLAGTPTDPAGWASPGDQPNGALGEEASPARRKGRGAESPGEETGLERARRPGVLPAFPRGRPQQGFLERGQQRSGPAMRTARRFTATARGTQARRPCAPTRLWRPALPTERALLEPPTTRRHVPAGTHLTSPPGSRRAVSAAQAWGAPPHASSAAPGREGAPAGLHWGPARRGPPPDPGPGRPVPAGRAALRGCCRLLAGTPFPGPRARERPSQSSRRDCGTRSSNPLS